MKPTPRKTPRKRSSTPRTSQIEILQRRLDEAEETLRAIRSGEVDAIVVSGAQGEQVFTLKDADRPYRQLAEQMAEGAFTASVEGVVLFANSSLVQLLHTRPEDLVGTQLSRWVALEDHSRYEALVRDARQSQGRGEICLLSATGEILPVQLSLSLLQTDAETMLTGIVVDLRERKHAENSLHEAWLAVQELNVQLERRVVERTSELQNANARLGAEIRERERAEQQARDLIRYAPTAIYEIDFRGPRFTRVNDAMCAMSGYSRAELLAMDPFDLLDEESRRRFQERIRRSAARLDIDESVEYKTRTKDGQEHDALLLTRLLLSDGKPAGAFVIAHDITERKRVEERIRKLNDILQVQAEELESANVVLEQQAEELKVANSQLEQQSSELQALNVQLEEALSEKQAALEEAETGQNILMALMEYAPGVIAIADASGISIRLMSRYAETLLGRSRQELIGALGTDHPLQHQLFKSDGVSPIPYDELPIVRAVARGEIVSGYEMVVRRDRAEPAWVMANAAPIRNSGGQVTGGIAVWVDITARKRAEGVLRESEERYRLLHEALRDPFVQVAMDGHVVECNELYCAMLGYSHEEIRLLTYQDLTPERWRAVEDRLVREQVIPRGYSDVYEKEYRRKDGTMIPVELRTILSRDAQGQPVAMWAVVRDITERKRAEDMLRSTLEELRLSEERFRTALKHAPITVYNQDLDLHYTWAFNTSGIATSEMIGKRAGEITPPYAPTLDAIKRRVIETGVGSRQEINAIGLDGKEHSYDLAVEPLVARTGQIIGVTCASIDITEYRLAARRIQMLNEQLELRALELELANQELESFSYSVSHDLRTPLVTIDSLAQILQDDFGDQLPPPAQRHLDLIRTGTRQMQELIASLLGLSRASRQALKKQPVNMRELVSASLETFKTGLERPGLMVELGELADAPADPVLLKQVWLNLIGNALKFTRKRTQAKIEIGCGSFDNANCVYYIRDNGVGFSMEQAERLFGIFQRLHGEEEYEGTGIGLALVKRIIQRHGGRVWAEGEEGQGATFYFTLGV